MAAEGVAFAVLLSLDGSVWWRLARVLVALAATTLAVRLTCRAGRAGRGATALVLGIAGTAAGFGVAGAHLAKAGLDAAAALAVVVLVTGVFLLTWGALRWSGRSPVGGGCWPSRLQWFCCGLCCSR
jgi:lipopolysaccharide export LptBFGC system permease protein LptF